jgi:recombination protein RecT
MIKENKMSITVENKNMPVATASNAKQAVVSASQETNVTDVFRGLIDSNLENILEQVPSLDKDAFKRLALTAFRKNKQLQQCSLISVLECCVQSAQVGLEPNTTLGHAYVIPYGKEAQFQIGYLGLLELCYRTGEYASISAHAVYAEDEFEYELGLTPRLVHKPSDEPSGDPIRYYATFTRKDGGYGLYSMSRKQVLSHAEKYSKSYNPKYGTFSGPWKTHFDAMALGTCLKKALKYAQKTTDLAKSIAVEEHETIVVDAANG